MPPAIALDACLRANPLFSGAADEQIGSCARASRRRTHRRGQSLSQEGEPSESLLLVLRGLVKLTGNLADGSDTMLGVVGPRECVGLVTVLAGARLDATAVALTPEVEVVAIPAPVLLQSMRADTGLALAVSRSLTQQAEILRTKIDVMSAGQVPQRLAALFLNLADRFGDDLEDDSLVVPVVLSRGELSSLIGARVETTIRVLSSWHKAGLVMTTREGFVIPDRAVLEAELRLSRACAA
jgi:CRP-like cAMP-binding protein